MGVEGFPTLPGVYLIANLCDGRLYVGATKNLRHRFTQHRSRLRRGKHENRHLQAAWDCWGEENFAFHVLAVDPNAASAALESAEAYWITRFDARDRSRGYNLYTAAREQPTETRARQSELRRGVRLSPEHRENIRRARLGTTATLESRQKHSFALKGRKPADHVLAAAREANSRTYRVSSPSGETQVIRNLTQFSREHGLRSAKMFAVASGVWRQHRGWLCERVGE